MGLRLSHLGIVVNLMRKSTPIRPLDKDPYSEPASDSPQLPEESASPPLESDHRLDSLHRKQRSGSYQAKSLLSRIVASRHNSNAGKAKRGESDAATAAFEDSFDPATQQASQLRTFQQKQTAVKLLSLAGKTGAKHSQERKSRRLSTRVRAFLWYWERVDLGWSWNIGRRYSFTT